MIIIFQDKLMYMSWMPPFNRSEKLEDYTKECRGVDWEENQIQSLDRTKLAVCVGRFPAADVVKTKEVVICYFQGNGGSTLLRLSLLSNILRSISERGSSDTRYTIVALSYRGYWHSAGRATKSGVEKDAQALLNWVSDTFPEIDSVILWGHSLGSAVASAATASYLSKRFGQQKDLPVTGLVLETPSTSTKDLLTAMYPQRWLPYRYLWILLWNNWKTAAALKEMAHAKHVPRILLLIAEKDEMMPREASDNLMKLCADLELDAKRVIVPNALHTEASVRMEGREALVEFVLDASTRNIRE